MKKPIVSLVVAAMATLVGLGAGAAEASSRVSLNGSFADVTTKPRYVPCPRGTECGSIELLELGAADWAYMFGPTFKPAGGRCFDVDGTFTLTLQSDGSSTSGPLTGIYCPGPAGPAHEHAGKISYGNPFRERDTITFGGGTGQFDGLSGIATFDTFSAGARFTGTMQGTLS